ncbi:MAG: HD domain-containing phosphohydrolase [Pseudomonadota bacterium]|nr:HD domain-containing phosphohydrolase [Pseudomonadota bacterium]
MSQVAKKTIDPFTQLDSLIPELSDLYTAIKSKHEKAAAMMDQLMDTIIRVTDANPDAALAAIHLSRQTSPLKQPVYCAVIAHLFAQQQSLDANRSRALMQAVLFCNITFYEFQVLLNRMDGKLTDAQRAKLEKHPLQSATIMEAAGFMDPQMIKAIRQHHERPDGSGYPNRLPSKDISDLALVVSMCEVYTARIDNRAHRKPVLAREALSHFQNGDDARIKGLLLNFAKSIGLYPPGTWVKLASGETAIVIKRNPSSPIPIVRALFDPNNIPYMGPVPRDAKDPNFKVTGATSPPARPSVDLSALFE